MFDFSLIYFLICFQNAFCFCMYLLEIGGLTEKPTFSVSSSLRETISKFFTKSKSFGLVLSLLIDHNQGNTVEKDLVVEWSPVVQETWVQSQIESYQRLKKMVLDATLLNTQHYKVKWSNPGKGVAPSPTLWCSSYWKGSFWVTLDYSHQLYLQEEKID